MQRLLSASARQLLPRVQQAAELQRAGGAGVARRWFSTDEDSHDDFKPQGIPEAPMCGFSNMACRILDAYGELGAQAGPRLAFLASSGRAHGNIFIGGEFVGGSDILYDLHQKGELGKMLADAKPADA
eukprot:scaffold13.g262.t1